MLQNYLFKFRLSIKRPSRFIIYRLRGFQFNLLIIQDDKFLKKLQSILFKGIRYFYSFQLLKFIRINCQNIISRVSKQYYNMERENETIYHTNNKSHQKQYLNSFHVFEPDYFINSAFTLTDSQQRHTSKLLDQPFNLTPIQPSHALVQESKDNFKGKSIKGNDIYESAVKIRKTATPSIENIVIQYQKNQKQSNPFKGFILNKMQDIFDNKPQFSSIEIKTTRLAKELGLHLRKPSSLQSHSFEEVGPEQNEDPIEKISITSIKYIQNHHQQKKFQIMEQENHILPQSKQLLNQIEQNKKINNKLQKITDYLKNYGKNKRQTSAKQHQKQIDWSIVRIMIEKELKCCGSS